MPSSSFTYTTGTALLQDAGVLSYNGCTFSPLFVSTVSAEIVKDTANRTTKYMKYTIEVDGFVTAPVPAVLDGINPTTQKLRQLLTVQCGHLVYQGRGFDIEVNTDVVLGEDSKGNTVFRFDQALRDVAWGPIPELLEFQPLGDANSAKVRWRVSTCVVEVTGPSLAADNSPLLQFNVETSVTYGEDYFSTCSVKGTMEIAQTRITGRRTVFTTVDQQRAQLEARLFRYVDLSRFRITNRQFSITRDKRTMEFEYAVEEKPYMDLPPNTVLATGTFNVRPAKAGFGLVEWVCMLQATYTVPSVFPRRVAWWAFLMLLRERMRFRTDIPWAAPNYDANVSAENFWGQMLNNQTAVVARDGPFTRLSFLNHFAVEEGLYQNSKTTTFTAGWMLVSRFQNILENSGLWHKVPELGPNLGNLWAASMKNFSGSQTWLANRLDPAADAVVDFGVS